MKKKAKSKDSDRFAYSSDAGLSIVKKEKEESDKKEEYKK